MPHSTEMSRSGTPVERPVFRPAGVTGYCGLLTSLPFF